jgi:hypothetical protein
MKIKLTIAVWLAFLLVGCKTETPNQKLAKLNFPLPAQARYTVTDEQFEAAITILQQNFSANTNRLAVIISPPCMCGPGLWHLLKDSPFFSTPPRAKTVCKIPLANGKIEELPAALIQDETEAANFRAALAVLISNDGNLLFRLPTEKEFKTYWATIPFNEINDALIVAEGNDYNVFVSFSKGKPFWFDEVKNFGSKQ